MALGWWHLDEEPCAGLVGNALAFVVYVLLPAAAVVAVVAAVVGSAAEVGMSVVVVAAAQERQQMVKGDWQQLERASRRLQLFLIELLSFISE